MVKAQETSLSASPANQDTIGQQYVEAQLQVPYPKPSTAPCSCVEYVRTRRGDLDVTWGTPYLYAKKHQGKEEPWVGAVAITKEGKVWHAVHVEWVSATEIGISEQNYEKAPGCPVTRRILKRASSTIHAYF